LKLLEYGKWYPLFPHTYVLIFDDLSITAVAALSSAAEGLKSIKVQRFSSTSLFSSIQCKMSLALSWRCKSLQRC
jgi:hypothetical protein